MATLTLIKKLNKEVGELKHEMREVKQFLLEPLADTEGTYRSTFVKKVLARAQSLGPFYKFADRQSFLTHVRSAK